MSPSTALTKPSLPSTPRTVLTLARAAALVPSAWTLPASARPVRVVVVVASAVAVAAVVALAVAVAAVVASVVVVEVAAVVDEAALVVVVASEVAEAVSRARRSPLTRRGRRSHLSSGFAALEGSEGSLIRTSLTTRVVGFL
jgi:hypothetical protein